MTVAKPTTCRTGGEQCGNGAVDGEKAGFLTRRPVLARARQISKKTAYQVVGALALPSDEHNMTRVPSPTRRLARARRKCLYCRGKAAAALKMRGGPVHIRMYNCMHGRRTEYICMYVHLPVCTPDHLTGRADGKQESPPLSATAQIGTGHDGSTEKSAAQQLN